MQHKNFMHRLYLKYIKSLKFETFLDPSTCQPWKETDVCGDKCKSGSTKLETRMCHPVHPGVVFNETAMPLIRDGTTPCKETYQCKSILNLWFFFF